MADGLHQGLPQVSQLAPCNTASSFVGLGTTVGDDSSHPHPDLLFLRARWSSVPVARLDIKQGMGVCESGVR